MNEAFSIQGLADDAAAERSPVSYACGTGAEPLTYLTVGGALDRAVAAHGDRPALIVRHQAVRWTYRELAAAVDATAAGLVALGLQPGERVGIYAPNCAEWVVTQFATAKAGLVLVNINPAYRLSELEYALNKVGCRALVLASRFKSSDYVAMMRRLAPEIDSAKKGALDAAKLPALKVVAVIDDDPPPGFLAFAEIAAAATAASRRELTERAASLEPDDPINIQFTSGTTGRPKGATLTHHNIVNNGHFVTARQGFTEADRLCIPVPLYHCFGMVMGVLGCVTHGACMVFPGEAFEPESVLAAVAEERCTALYGVPTMFIAELQHPDFATFDLSALRTGVMAGSPCPIEVMRRVIDEMNMAEVTICYGMTETSPVSLQTMADDPLEKRIATVGRVLPFVEVKIIDADGHTVGRGVQGELCTRGYSLMRGYWDDAERTGEAIDAAGWMHTGDLATMDGEGYVAITGRVKDMIIRGGENIYPRELEELLFRHPTVGEVAVVGLPDDRLGEVVAAFVRPAPGQRPDRNALFAYAREHLSPQKTPKHWFLVDAFPLTGSGKIQKFRLRELWADGAYEEF